MHFYNSSEFNKVLLIGTLWAMKKCMTTVQEIICIRLWYYSAIPMQFQFLLQEKHMHASKD